ncbi:MAG: right-handed parallel beta-helix repeat-containing protein [bacterium]
MKVKLTIIVAVCMVAFQLTATAALANVITVQKSGGNYTTIQAAINAASPGDIIKVGPGVYYENIIINKRVELIGSGATAWIPQPPSTSIGLLKPDELLIAKYPIKPILPDPPPESIIISPERIFSGEIIRGRDDLFIPASTAVTTATTSAAIPVLGNLIRPVSVILQPLSKDIEYPGVLGSTVKIPSYGTVYTGQPLVIPNPLPFLVNGSIISGNGKDHVVTITKADSCRIGGFTITNSGSDHAGIFLSSSSDVTIANNRISKNKDGIVTSDSSAIIQNNIFNENGYSDNPYTDYGICCLSSILSINNNLIFGQEVGIYVAWEKSGGTVVINNTITGNQYDGVWCYKCSPTIMNNIITQNGFGICAIYGAAPAISYNDVWGNGDDYNQQTGGVSAPGVGDICADPMFVNAGQGDYHLATDSPCIDMGDPKPVYNDPDGTRNDMGAYGGFGAVPGTGLSAGSGFIFTDVGNIPTSEIPQNQSDPSFGLARVSSTAASKLKIHQWVDCPFGGQIRLFGQFGMDDKVDYYQILIGRWNGNTAPGASDFVPLNDPLAKVRSVLDGQKVNHEIVSLGPKVMGGLSSLYELNKGVYWSQPSLRMIWDTTAWQNGKYTLKYRAFRLDSTAKNLIEVTPGSSDPLTVSPTDLDHLIVIVNNSQVEAKIHWVKYTPGSPEYDPAVDGNIPECAVIHLNHTQENLRFVITASHPEGYLDYFSLDCLWGKNKPGGLIHSETYATATSSSPHSWMGVTQQEFSLPGTWDQWHPCAYQFRLVARSRATDGYTYLYGREFNDHYTIEIGNEGCTSSSGLPGDLNNDGRVTIDEVTRVINAFLGRP